MNESIEYGWIVIHNDKVLREAHKNEDENGLFIPDAKYDTGSWTDQLYIETHPHNTHSVFVSLGTLKHGDIIGRSSITAIEEPMVGQIVRDYIRSLDPDSIVLFGVIRTRR